MTIYIPTILPHGFLEQAVSLIRVVSVIALAAIGLVALALGALAATCWITTRRPRHPFSPSAALRIIPRCHPPAG